MVHKSVDRHLIEKVPSLVGPLKISLGEATKCPVCNKAVDLNAEVSHALLQFLTFEVVPMMSQVNCLIPGHILDLTTKTYASVYKQIRKHIDKNHIKEAM